MKVYAVFDTTPQFDIEGNDIDEEFFLAVYFNLSAAQRHAMTISDSLIRKISARWVYSPGANVFGDIVWRSERNKEREADTEAGRR